MQDIWTLEKYCIWSVIVYPDQNGKNNMETLSLEVKGASQIT